MCVGHRHMGSCVHMHVIHMCGGTCGCMYTLRLEMGICCFDCSLLYLLKSGLWLNPECTDLPRLASHPMCSCSSLSSPESDIRGSCHTCLGMSSSPHAWEISICLRNGIPIPHLLLRLEKFLSSSPILGRFLRKYLCWIACLLTQDKNSECN